ncbi:BTB/POZ/MATH-domain protein [Rhynchospora pubera]|uniref:BTB/POZ/MATH-domain protein n=1 Tax=Rhynchospora pubera TaxID=906938 RepID=A0AAV8DAN1_9POAL|nr:BTB/POZ/MATH-domain protein [Rhynchospora pubera]
MSSSAVDNREPETDHSAWFAETCTGSHLLNFVGCNSFEGIEGIGVGKCITSGIFTLCGYNWTIGFYPKGKWSLYDLAFDLNLKGDAKGARFMITMTLLCQNGRTPRVCEHPSGAVILGTNGSSCISNFVFEQNHSRWCFIDCINYSTVRCTITKLNPLNKTSCKPHPFAVQPSNLNEQLACLLERGDGTDVSFNVNGVTFDAHKCVLATRSPVFRAQFFGPMKVKMNESIEIKDMKPSVFKSMLHFIYSDSVAELEEAGGNRDASVVLAQHLLVAADWFGLERLKQLCERKMYELIDANNVATTLTLAEQHNCYELKAACMEFNKPPEVFAIVAQTEGFDHMIRSCPAILQELHQFNVS